MRNTVDMVTDEMHCVFVAGNPSAVSNAPSFESSDEITRLSMFFGYVKFDQCLTVILADCFVPNIIMSLQQ